MNILDKRIVRRVIRVKKHGKEIIILLQYADFLYYWGIHWTGDTLLGAEYSSVWNKVDSSPSGITLRYSIRAKLNS